MQKVPPTDARRQVPALLVTVVERAGQHENSVADTLMTYARTKAKVFAVLDELARDQYLMKLELIDQQEEALEGFRYYVLGWTQQEDLCDYEGPFLS